MTTESVWWGTYPEAGLGTPTGLGEGLWRQDSQSAAQVCELPAPAFVIAHPELPLLYAVSEADNTEVHVVDVADARAPRVVATVATGGSSGCHLLLGADASALYVSHYVSGELAVLLLGDDGLPTTDAPAQVFAHEGSGPRQDRQEAPHAHFAGFGPGGHHVLVCDLGTDELRRYALRADGTLDDHGIAATLPAGSGPRHFAMRGEYLYVTCELDHRLRALRWDGASGTAEVIHELPLTTAAPRTDHELAASHVLMVDEGLLLVGVRGADVIALFDLSPEGEPRYRASFDAGHWPRHFAIASGRLHVGAERGHQVRAYALDDVRALPPESGVGDVATLPFVAAALPSPACALPWNR